MSPTCLSRPILNLALCTVATSTCSHFGPHAMPFPKLSPFSLQLNSFRCWQNWSKIATPTMQIWPKIPKQSQPFYWNVRLSRHSCAPPPDTHNGHTGQAASHGHMAQPTRP